MLHTFIKLFAYEVCELLPLGADAHMKLFPYYLHYTSITYQERLICMLALGVGVLLCSLSDFYKMFKELFTSSWLLMIGRGTISQACTELKHLNLLLSIVAIGAVSYPAAVLNSYIGDGYYVIGFMLIVSGLMLRVPETFAFIKTDGRLLRYKEVFFFMVFQVLSSFSGAARMAIMMGGGKFLGIEKKHLIKFVFLSFVPVIFVKLALSLDSISTLYQAVTAQLGMFVILVVACMVFVWIAVKIFMSEGFYKFYYYLMAIGAWTLLDVFFRKRGL